MVEARTSDDRLPWLDAPRPPARPARAARRARTPLLVLLGLFLASAIGVMAYLTGRGTAPVASSPTPREALRAPSPAPIAPAPVPAPAPTAPAPVLPIAPVAAIPARPATPPVAIKTVKASKARATWAASKRVASARSAVRRRVAARAARDARIQRNARRARAESRRYRWPANFAAAPSGRVVQLGAYYSGRQTNAAWLRLRRAYPYLATLPRKVIVTAPRAGRPRYYRLRIGTRSAREARALCDTLHRIGRGCIVV